MHRRLVTGFLITFLFAIAVPSLAQNTHAQWKDEIAALLAGDADRPPPQNGVVFVGSSSIHMWTSLATDFPGAPVVNRGFGGSEISDSTFYADRIVVPLHPRLIVFYAGDNDIYAGHSPDQVVTDFKAFVATVRARLPNTAIAFVTIKPSVARWALWPAMHQANDGIAAWASTQKDIRVVDVAAPMLDANGKPRPDLFRADGLHMTPAGYAIWIAALRPVLAEYGFHTR